MCFLSCFAPSGPVVPKRRQFTSQAPPSADQRPPSPPGPPPSSLPPGNDQQDGVEAQSTQDISPAVAAALLQLMSQQDPEAAASQHSKDASPAEDTQAAGLSPPPWVTGSPPKPSAAAKAPAGHFPKDQDLRFSHGSAR